MISWADCAEYIAAGCVGAINFGNDLDAVSIKIWYGNFRDGIMTEKQFRIECRDVCLAEIRRSNGHTPGSSANLEAYLHDASPLLSDVISCRRDSIAGSLIGPDKELNRARKHLQIVGEVSIDIVCGEVTVYET